MQELAGDSLSTVGPEAIIPILMASVASAVLTAVIVADRKHRYIAAAVFGLAAGVLLRLTPAGQLVAERAEGVFQWAAQPIIGILFALGWCAIADGLLSSNIPLLKSVRPRGRWALRASRWGTAEEIGERAGMDPGIVALLGVHVEAPEMTPWRRINRLRISAHVLSGSLVGLFFAIREFRLALWHNFTLDHIVINLIGTMLVTFFIGPLHEAVMHLPSGGGDHAEPPRPRDDRRLLRGQVFIFVVVAVVLFLLQAVHAAAHDLMLTMTLYSWILLFELCALPLIVTTYYFGVALYHGGLGEQRWDRALEASVWFGAIVLLPFALTMMLNDAFPAGLRDSLLQAVMNPGNGTSGTLMVGLMSAYLAIVIAAVMATLGSIATYGVYAAALGLAMTDSTRATARWRAIKAVLWAGLVAQILTAAFAYYSGLLPSPAYVVHLCIALGWAAGLYLSGFERELVESSKPKPVQSAPDPAPPADNPHQAASDTSGPES